jgi:triphosphoribosyl-dephospho-CoA synthetase
MFLEILTLAMLGLVIALKYGAVTRILKLNQKLREVESICKRHAAYLDRKRSERKVAERDETNLTRQQVGLESEMERLDSEWTELKNSNTEVLKELLPGFKGSEEELLKSTGLGSGEGDEVSKN